MNLVSWVWMNWTQILNIKDSNSLDATWRVYEDLSIKTHILLMLLEDVNRKSRLEWNLKNQDFKKFQEMWGSHVTETRSVRSWTRFQQDNAELKKGRFSKCVLITLLKLSWSFAVLDLLSAFFNRGGEERGSVYVGCFGPHMSHYVPHGGCMLQSWEQAGLLRRGQPVWPRKQDPKTLHSSEKSWGGRLVETNLPADLSSWRERPASGWSSCSGRAPPTTPSPRRRTGWGWPSAGGALREDGLLCPLRAHQG